MFCKKLSIIAIVSIYLIGIIVTFSGNLIHQIQITRHQNQIKKISKAETLEFSLIEWNNFSDLNEINFKNTYYDVVSCQKVNNKIIAKVVKDDFENETSIAISKIFHKSNMPISNKKKSNSFSKHILLERKFICTENLNFQVNIIENFVRIFNSNTINYINFQEKPPCIINFYSV